MALYSRLSYKASHLIGGAKVSYVMERRGVTTTIGTIYTGYILTDAPQVEY